eukprot:287091_1
MALCFLQHENEIQVPQLVQYGGSITFKDDFSINWLYTKLSFLILTSILYIICLISYTMEYGFIWWFTYYEYLNFLFLVIYFILSFIITIRIYRYIKNNELPYFLQTMNQHHLTTDTEDDNNNDPHTFYKNLTVQSIKSGNLGKCVAFFQYISLVGLWCGAILYWMHEFEINVFENDTTYSMQFIIIITNLIIQIIVIIDFFMSGFRLKYSGFIWPLFTMIIIIFINLIQILFDEIELNGEYDQHLFTELKWNTDIESALVTCFWSMAILLICNVSFTFIKNICLCKWSINQRQRVKYPRAQEAMHEVEI